MNSEDVSCVHCSAYKTKTYQTTCFPSANLMCEPAAAEFVSLKRRKIVTEHANGDDEYDCVSAKRRILSMVNSPGNFDDSGWNVSCVSSFLTAPKNDTTMTNTSTTSVYYDADDDDRQGRSEDVERTLCDLILQPSTENGM